MISNCSERQPLWPRPCAMLNFKSRKSAAAPSLHTGSNWTRNALLPPASHLPRGLSRHHQSLLKLLRRNRAAARDPHRSCGRPWISKLLRSGQRRSVPWRKPKLPGARWSVM